MRSSIQIALFLFIAAAVRAAETINAYASVHWREFATQNYFDRRGVFASVVFCAPLLIVAFGQLMAALHSCSQLIVRAKREQVRAEARKRGEEGKTGASDARARSSAGAEASESASKGGSTLPAPRRRRRRK